MPVFRFGYPLDRLHVLGPWIHSCQGAENYQLRSKYIQKVSNTHDCGAGNFLLMDTPADADLAPSYLLHRLNRIRKLPPAHPFQTLSAEKFSAPELPNQISDDTKENGEVVLAESQMPSLHWGAAVRAIPLLPPHLGRVLDKSRSATPELGTRQTGESRISRLRSLYATLPTATSLRAEEVLGALANKTAEATCSENAAAATAEKAVPAQVPRIARPETASAARAVTDKDADNSDATGVMAAWISQRKAFDTGSLSWDLQMPLYSQVLIEDLAAMGPKQKQPGVVADLRARAVQRRVKGVITSKKINVSEEEQMQQREQIELMKRKQKAQDIRLGRLIAEDEVADKVDDRVTAATFGKTGTKTNLELEFEAVQARAIQAAREKRRELTLASSSRMRAVGHVYEDANDVKSSMAEVELRLEAFQTYKLNIPSRDAYQEHTQEALKKVFYFAAGNAKDQDFFIYGLQNSGTKEPYSVDASGCRLSEVAASGLGLMMSTPLNQLTVLNARDVLITSSGWRFMCDGLRLTRTLALLDISFARMS